LGIITGLLLMSLIGLGAAKLGGLFDRSVNACTRSHEVTPSLAAVTLAGDPCTQANATATATLAQATVATVTPVPQATNTPRPQPTNTPHSQPTRTAAPAAKLNINAQPNAFCYNGQYPPITVKNTGGSTLNWTASSGSAGVTVSPASGSLAPGAMKILTVSGPVPPTIATVSITVKSNGGNLKITFTCQ